MFLKISRTKKTLLFFLLLPENRLREAVPTYRFDVTVQETNRVDALNSLQYLPAKSERGAYSERPTVCTSSQIRQITTLQ